MENKRINTGDTLHSEQSPSVGMTDKEKCRFYDSKKGKCIALKSLYCEKEKKVCAFFKEKDGEKRE